MHVLEIEDLVSYRSNNKHTSVLRLMQKHLVRWWEKNIAGEVGMHRYHRSQDAGLKGSGVGPGVATFDYSTWPHRHGDCVDEPTLRWG